MLNVLSGMDTYEEGELLICGEPTSHYLQSDWEEYRKQYISFIFQEYNIIESFTVLQNVELALMNISDRRARRGARWSFCAAWDWENSFTTREASCPAGRNSAPSSPAHLPGQPHHSGGRADRQSGQPDLGGDYLAPARGLPATSWWWLSRTILSRSSTVPRGISAFLTVPWSRIRSFQARTCPDRGTASGGDRTAEAICTVA